MDSLPMSFGRVAPKKSTDDRIATTKRADASSGPVPGPSRITDSDNVQKKEQDHIVLEKPRRMPDEDDEENEEEEDGGEYIEPTGIEGADLPVTHEIVMKDHTKTVSALSLDPSGTRVASGSYDYDCKLWDFSGMNAAFKPFRSWECVEGHQVRDTQFSITGDSFLATTGSLQPKLYDRDGLEIAMYIKGDMYIRDLRHTAGHVGPVNATAWHPKQSGTFLSCSDDSTIRLWDANVKQKSKSVIVVKSKERGGKTRVSACAWSPDGKTIGGACQDGTLHLWSASSNFARPNSSIEGAHEKGTVTGSMVFAGDGRHVATRGGDDTVKMWDIRAFKKPLFVASSISTLNAETNLCFSPDDKYVLTGTAGSMAGVLSGQAEEEKEKEMAGKEGGKVLVMKKEGLDVVRSLNISPFSVVKVLWHPKINQIVTGSADGSIHVLYSPLTSLKGATLAVTRAPRTRAPDDFSTGAGINGPIIAPHALPMFKDDLGQGPDRIGKRKRERERHDPQKTMKPTPPVVGPGKGGRIGAAATQHVVRHLIRNEMRDQDPREALLKYATKEGENEWTAAWNQTQPKPVFDMRPDLDQEEKDRKAEEKAAKESAKK